jgi:hypothetical protein
MAITSTYTLLPKGNAATLSQGVTVANSVSVEPAAVLLVTLTGDGAATTAVVNWIDGVNTLSYTPSAVLAFAANIGSTAATGALAVEGNLATPRVSAITTTSFTLNFATTIANAGTFTVIVLVYR